MPIVLTQRGGLIIGNLAKLFGYVMNAIYEMLYAVGIQNIAVSIIVFTIVAYLIMLPLTMKQHKDAILMKRATPELNEIKMKYKGLKDAESTKLQKEEMEQVYKKHGISKQGGCLLTLIQMPILLSLWPVVSNVPAYVTRVKDAYMPLIESIMSINGYQDVMQKVVTESQITINTTAAGFENPNTLVDILSSFYSKHWNILTDAFPQLSLQISETKEVIEKYNFLFGLNITESSGSIIRSAFSSREFVLIAAAAMVPILVLLCQLLNQNIKTIMQRIKGMPVAKRKGDIGFIFPFISAYLAISLPIGLGIYWITGALVRTILQIFIDRYFNRKLNITS